MATAKKKRKRVEPRSFRQVTAADVTDEKLLLGEFRAFRAEIAGLLRDSILPALKRLEIQQDSIAREQVAQHAELAEHRGAIAEHDRRIAALEGRDPPSND